MSYIRGKRVDRESSEPITIQDVIAQYHGVPDLDADLNFEMLDFVLDLIAQVNALNGGEALVVWKEIF